MPHKIKVGQKYTMPLNNDAIVEIVAFTSVKSGRANIIAVNVNGKRCGMTRKTINSFKPLKEVSNGDTAKP